MSLLKTSANTIHFGRIKEPLRVKDYRSMLTRSTVSSAKDAVIEKVYEANKTDVPRVMVEDEIDRMAQELDHQLRYQGLSLEQYLQFMQKDAARIQRRAPRRCDQESRNPGDPDVHRRGREGIEVSDEELEEELKNMAVQYNTDAEQMREDDRRGQPAVLCQGYPAQEGHRHAV